MKEYRGRILALAFSLLAAAPFAQAQAPKKPGYDLFLSSEAGILSGEALEIVYYGPGSSTIAADYLVSRLDWSLKGLPFWGSRLEMQQASGFYASLGLKSALPGLYGSIEDRDWLNNDGVLTHYSKHDNHVERAFFAELAAGWEFRPAGPFSWRLGLGLELMSFKWTARDGYTQYPPDPPTPPPGQEPEPYDPWSLALPMIKSYGTGMAYEQLHLIPSLELGAGYALSEEWRLAASLGFSFLAYCQDLDNHFLRALEFREWMYGGLYLEPGLELSRALKPGAELLLRASWRSITGLLGDTLLTDTTSGVSDPIYADSGGAGYSALSLGLALRMRL